MMHTRDHASNRRRVRTLDQLIHAPKAHAANRLPHILGTADEAAHPSNLQRSRFFLSGHSQLPYAVATSAAFPRSSFTFAASFKCSNASKVALITLCGFDVPIDLVSTF